MTEYLYDKENPRSKLRYKPQGWESFYRGMPNQYERAEMIGRRLLKDYDGDLSKISLVTKKPYDPGQKWRTLKNMSRLYRNPLGFFIWRYLYAAKMGSAISPWYLFSGVCILAIVGQIAAKQKQTQDYINRYRYNRGQRGFFPMRGYEDNRLVAGPFGTTTFKKKTANFNAQNKNMNANNVTTAYWCRDQNFRKYFEMRKKHGIAPSIDYNTFYNKDKCKDYYYGLLEAAFLRNRVDNIKG